MSETVDRVTGVHMFAIKSCHETTVEGQLPSALQVGETGFEAQGVRDREFVMVEDMPRDAEQSPLFVSQRGWDEAEHPVKGRHDNRLAVVETNIRAGRLEIVAPGLGSLSIMAEYDGTAPKRDVRIFESILPQALDQGDEAAGLFSEVLGRPVRLVRTNRSVPRELPKEYRRTGAANKVAGADGFPFLLTNQASLDAANEASGLDPDEYVDLRQYRGTTETDGVAMGPWGEDYIRKVKIGSTVMYLVKPSARCIITNIKQSSGEGGVKGLRVLRSHKGRLAEGKQDKPLFGQNGNHVYDPENPAWISVGDEITVLERAGEPNFIPAEAA